MGRAIAGLSLVVALLTACNALSGASDLSIGGARDGGSSGNLPATSPGIVDGGSKDGGRTPDGVPCGASLDVDPMNCGSCGRSCASGFCFDGLCGGNLLTPSANALIATGGGRVYFAEPAAGSVKSIAAGGGDASVHATGHHPNALVADDVGFVWTNDPESSNATVMSCQGPLCAGGPVVAGQTSSAITPAIGGGSFVYWVSEEGTRTELYRGSRAGGAFATVPTDMVIQKSGIAVDDSSVFWAQCCGTNAGIYRLATVGETAPERLTTNALRGVSYVDASDVWFLDLGGSLYRAPKAFAGTPTAVGALATNAKYAIDGGDVYWASGRHIQLVRGGITTPFAVTDDPSAVSAVAVDVEHVYWSTATGIYWAPKP